MHSLLDLDKVQLDRLNQGIEGLSGLPPQQRERKLCLLLALEAEREELIRANPSIRITTRKIRAAA